MLWTIFVILLILWALGMVSSYTLGGFIHILLEIALVVVLLLVVIVLHLTNPFRRGVQGALLALVLVHALLGVRALLLDFGLPLSWHRALFVLALVVAAAVFVAVWSLRWY